MAVASIGAADFAKMRPANSIKNAENHRRVLCVLASLVYRRRCFLPRMNMDGAVYPRRMRLIGPLTWLQFRLLISQS